MHKDYSPQFHGPQYIVSLFIGKRSVNNGARQGWKPKGQHDSKDKPDSDVAAY